LSPNATRARKQRNEQFLYARGKARPAEAQLPPGPIRQSDHEIWHSPITNRNFPVDGKILSRYTANAIMKQAGIAHKF
jgi:hypothetical protein